MLRLSYPRQEVILPQRESNGAEHFATAYLSLYCFGKIRHRDARAAEIAHCADYIIAFGSLRFSVLFNLFNVKRSLHAIVYVVCINT